MRDALLAVLLLASLAAGACASGKDDASATTVVERRKVSTSTGGAMASLEAPPEEPEAADPAAPAAKCKHDFEHVRDGTHAYMDETGEIPMAALCTPIVCRKCGETRHECAQRRRRR